MARRRHRRNPRRRHVRRNPRRHVVRSRRRSYRINARRRYRSNPRRHRSYRRNPFGLGGGVSRAIFDGIKDAGIVFAGQIVSRKLGNALNAMIPASVGSNSPILRGVIQRGLGAVATTIAAKKFTPKYAQLASAGAFLELITFVVQSQPTLNTFLSAYSRPVLTRGVSAYPLPAARVNGYGPLGLGGGTMPLIGLPTTVGMA